MNPEAFIFFAPNALAAPLAWQEPPRAVAAPAAGVHLWRLSLDAHGDEWRERLMPILSADERLRAAQLRFDVHRRRYVVCRAGLRMLIARYLETSPQEIRFEYGPHGKPALPPPAALQFNVSHCDDIALVAVTRDDPVGIDVERVNPAADHLAIAKYCFTPGELSMLGELSPADRVAAFCRLWTHREAICKAAGVGVAGLTPSAAFDELAAGCIVRELTHASEFTSALAIQAPRTFDDAFLDWVDHMSEFLNVQFAAPGCLSPVELGGIEHRLLPPDLLLFYGRYDPWGPVLRHWCGWDSVLKRFAEASLGGTILPIEHGSYSSNGSDTVAIVDSTAQYQVLELRRSTGRIARHVDLRRYFIASVNSEFAAP